MGGGACGDKKKHEYRVGGRKQVVVYLMMQPSPAGTAKPVIPVMIVV